MQRHPSLRRLSSENHSGLVFARRLREAAGQGASDQISAWKVAREYFRTKLEPHLQREEQGLLPILRVAGEVEKVDRVFREHKSLRFLVLQNKADNLSIFAESLATLIRFEENELLDAAQHVLGSKVLEDLEQVLNRSHVSK